MKRKENHKVKVKAPSGNMRAVQNTKKRGHASDEEPPAEKRLRVDSESSDPDNPLGISFEGYPDKLSGCTCLTWPSLTNPEPEIIDTLSSKMTANANAPENETDNRRDDAAAISTISIEAVKIDTPEELYTRLRAKLFAFKLNEVKIIMRWMKLTRTYKITDHKDDFNELLETLGFADPKLSKKDQDSLKTKTRTKLTSLNANLRRAGAINEAEGYESSVLNAPLVFAEWTNAWLKPGWDGSHLKPTKDDYEKAMNAKDGGAVAENGADQEFYENDLQLIVMSPLPDDPEGFANVPSPEENEGGADPNAWYNAELNKETTKEMVKEMIMSNDWNAFVVAAQHLGVPLPDIALLKDDPFPGYKPAVPSPFVTSEPPVNLTTSLTETSPSASPTTPTTPQPRRPAITFNISPTPIASSDSEGSVSLGDDDSDSHSDSETPEHDTITNAVEYLQACDWDRDVGESDEEGEIMDRMCWEN